MAVLAELLIKVLRDNVVFLFIINLITGGFPLM